MSGSLAYERTQLSWRRTVLSALVVALLCARLALESEPVPVAAVLVTLVGIAWLSLLVVAQRRIRRLDATDATPPARTFPLVVGLVSAYVAVSAILVLRTG